MNNVKDHGTRRSIAIELYHDNPYHDKRGRFTFANAAAFVFSGKKNQSKHKKPWEESAESNAKEAQSTVEAHRAAVAEMAKASGKLHNSEEEKEPHATKPRFNQKEPGYASDKKVTDSNKKMDEIERKLDAAESGDRKALKSIVKDERAKKAEYEKAKEAEYEKYKEDASKRADQAEKERSEGSTDSSKDKEIKSPVDKEIKSPVDKEKSIDKQAEAKVEKEKKEAEAKVEKEKKEAEAKASAEAAAKARENVKNYTAISKGLNSASEMAKKTMSLRETIRSDRAYKEASKIDLSSMTDKDLQAYVNRKNLEKQYMNAKAAEINTGKTKLDKVLEYGGAVLAIGASAASIAVAIHTLKT